MYSAISVKVIPVYVITLRDVVDPSVVNLSMNVELVISPAGF